MKELAREAKTEKKKKCWCDDTQHKAIAKRRICETRLKIRRTREEEEDFKTKQRQREFSREES